MKSQNNKINLIIKGRLHYAHIFNADHPFGDVEKEPVYSLTLLIPKTDTETVKAVKEKIKLSNRQAIQKGIITEAQIRSPKYWNPLQDGDEKADTKPEFKNTYYINMKFPKNKKDGGGETKPTVTKLIDGKIYKAKEGELYNGCWIQVFTSFFTYNKMGCGTSVAFLGVMKFKDDEYLDYTMGAGEMFKDFGTVVDEENEPENSVLNKFYDTDNETSPEIIPNEESTSEDSDLY